MFKSFNRLIPFAKTQAGKQAGRGTALYLELALGVLILLNSVALYLYFVPPGGSRDDLAAVVLECPYVEFRHAVAIHAGLQFPRKGCVQTLGFAAVRAQQDFARVTAGGSSPGLKHVFRPRVPFLRP